MKTLKLKSINGYTKKECAFCGVPFYAKTEKRKYCSDSHKVQFSQMVKKSHQWYSHNPNEGKVLPPGTVTSMEMSESYLIFQGDKTSLYKKLSEKVSEEQLIKEKVFIENLLPFTQTNEWNKSSSQIFTDFDFMEVFRISKDVYKFYVWPED